MITGVFGLPGSGKSTFLAWCASRALSSKPIKIGSLSLSTNKTYNKIYSNFPISGCYPLNFDLLGISEYSDCLILIDEISLLADSRNFKTFSDNCKLFFTMHRHWNVDIIWCGQSYLDCDVKIRRITEQLMFIEARPFGYSCVTPIFPCLGLDDFGHIVENYTTKGFFSRKYIKRKKYYYMFDSFQRPSLRPLRSCDPWPFDTALLRSLEKKGGAGTGAQTASETDFSHLGGKPPQGDK